MNTTYIYVLKCPISFEVKYVGKANNPKLRYYSHLNTSKSASSYKKNWIKKLKDKNLKPILEIIAEVPISSWKEYEKYYIRYYKSLGCELTNLGTGGEGLGFGNQTSFKKGVINYKKERLKKECLVCGKFFEVSPSGFKKYKCCSMVCTLEHRKTNINSGKFSKGNVPWNTGISVCTRKGKTVDQLDLNTGELLNTFSSMAEADRILGLCRGSVAQAVYKNSKSAGGFKWQISQKEEDNL